MKKENDRLSTADIAREGDYVEGEYLEGEHKSDRGEEWMVNRGEAEAPRADAPAMARERAPQASAEARAQRDTIADAPKTDTSRDFGTDQDIRLLERDEMMQMRQRWHDIQAGFVDEPRRSVEQADALVAEAMKRLAQVFARARQQLEQQWDRGEDVTTEDLRVTLQRYRAFFDRLLAI